MATRAPKEKRRNSEKRKEKSRDAARCRRSKESEIFTDLSQLLPVPSSLSSQLDKASIMRLTIAYLKARVLLGSNNEALFSDGSGASWPEEKCSVPNSYWPQALGGILMALSSEGDIIYLTENVTQQLGLPQVDLIGQSVFDYCHPCDHDELRDVLGWRADGELSRSFFLRFKSTLSVKGRSNNLKTALYKVMNCSGRIVRTDGAAVTAATTRWRPDLMADSDFDYCDDNLTEDESEESARKGMPSHFLVLIADPIPHPTNIELPLDGYTFLTKHSLDMKYTYVDEKINEFLGYVPHELEGHSAYEFHHVMDNDLILKSYKTMFTKGQMQTPSYRFLARNGGYAWVQTQATLVYGSRDSRPQAIVCVHSCLSGIEEGDQILCTSQAQAIGRSPRSLVASAPVSVPGRKAPVTQEKLPLKMTSKLFVNKTAEMNREFFMPNKFTSPCEIVKEELEDLTHLAPVAGDVCIPLEVPSVTFPGDLFDSEELMPELLDYLPLTGFELPFLTAPEESPVCEDEELDERSPSLTTNSSSIKEDPFLFFKNQTASVPNCAKSECDFDEDLNSVSPLSDQTDLRYAEKKSPLSLSEDDEELNRRAPYIPMSDDLPLFDTSELFFGLDLDSFPLLPQSKTDSVSAGSDHSVLVKLLQNNPIKEEKLATPLLNYQLETTTPCHALKRGSIGPLDEQSPKRMKAPCPATANTVAPSRMQYAQAPGHHHLPARGGNTSSLMELLTDRPAVHAQTPPQMPGRAPNSVASASVLQNLLVSGHDLQTGHDLQGQRGSLKSPSSPRLVSPLPNPNISQSARLKDQESGKAPYHALQRNWSAQQEHPIKEYARRNDSRLTDNSLFDSFGYELEASGDLGLDANDFFSALNLPVEFLAVNDAVD